MSMLPLFLSAPGVALVSRSASRWRSPVLIAGPGLKSFVLEPFSLSIRSPRSIEKSFNRSRYVAFRKGCSPMILDANPS